MYPQIREAYQIIRK